MSDSVLQLKLKSERQWTCSERSTFLEVPGQLVAGGADAETTLRADPVEVEESCVTSIAHLPQALHRSLPDGGHWGRDERDERAGRGHGVSLY